MPLQKQPASINFAQGLDTKTDPYQVEVGKFVALQNSIFDKVGRLTKRNGFGALTALPNTNGKQATTFSGNLTVIGDTLQSYSTGTTQWTNKGSIQLASLKTLPLYRSSNNQSQADAVVSANGLVCTVYTDNPASGVVYKYVVADSVTGQNIVEATTIAATNGTINNTPRVFLLGSYFIIAFGTSSNHIQYISISTANPASVTGAADITSSYVSSTTINWDALVVNSSLYFAFNSTAGGQSIKVTYLPSNLALAVSPSVFAAELATMFTLSSDMTNPASPKIYVSYYDLPSQVGKTLAVDSNLNTVLAPTAMIAAVSVLNLASTAINGVCTLFYEVNNNYGGAIGGVATHYISKRTITQAGVAGTAAVVVRSVGLASKAFLIDGVSYMLTSFNTPLQPTNFLINGSGEVLSRIAYSNAGPYKTTGLPNITITANVVQMSYLIKDLIAGINKGTALTSGTPVSPVYSQTGVNLVSFAVSTDKVTTAEIGNNLNISGGMLWAFDGVAPVEQGFNVWPEQAVASTSAGGGSISAQQYYYQFLYEWSDNQGNVVRSAPTIPVTVTASGGSSTNTLTIPTLRLTYKTNVKIIAYRWSTAQQVYYAITPPSAPPTLSNPTVDFVTITDTASDATILGNPILYTTGGVLENISAPASNLLTLFDSRLWMVDAEDPNLLWYSKQVIEATPVEMSDLLTIYIPPSTSSKGSTGPITSIAPLDDKLIVFKRDAMGYINGSGPDNTGANSQYSNFILINAVTGCANPQSIVVTPNGLMFESDKGIWQLDRGMGVSYIGYPVEALTKGNTVLSAINVPGTNQVRFTMSSGVTLMYDTFVGQWGSFINIPALSSTVVNSLHTYINSTGQVFQETPGLYLDNTSPVLMSFTTSWLNLAGVQGYERFYQMLLLGQYISPFKLNVQLAYDYNPSIVQSSMVTPLAPEGSWGGQQVWGSGGLWGGPSNVFEARVFPTIQKCESFQISITEVYDPQFGITAGSGLTLSGLNLTVGIKKGSRTSNASRNFGG